MTADGFNLSRNHHFRVSSEISNKTSALKIHNEVVTDAKVSIPGIDFNCFDSAVAKARTISNFQRRWKADQFQLRTLTEREGCDFFQLRTGFTADRFKK
jgi:hypothetical protein